MPDYAAEKTRALIEAARRQTAKDREEVRQLAADMAVFFRWMFLGIEENELFEKQAIDGAAWALIEEVAAEVARGARGRKMARSQIIGGIMDSVVVAYLRSRPAKVSRAIMTSAGLTGLTGKPPI